MAVNDPALFLQTYKPPLFIDEVQYAPTLFPYIKMHVDRRKTSGDFWLTGSQKYLLMKEITESLAGRAAIIDMLGLSSREIAGHADKSIPFLPTQEWVERARPYAVSSQVDEVYRRIWLGSYPRLVTDSAAPRDMFYSSYLQTYLERDVKDIMNVGNAIVFYNFLRTVAAHTGQLLNYSKLARDLEIDSKTAKAWLFSQVCH